MDFGESCLSVEFPTRLPPKGLNRFLPHKCRKGHPFDSDDTVAISLWTCFQQRWCPDRVRWHRVYPLLPRRPIRCRWAPHGKEFVTVWITLCYTCHETVLSLSRSPMTFHPSPSRERKSLVHVSVSGFECGTTLSFSTISRTHLFGLSHQPVRRISSLDITRSTPLGSDPHPSNQLRTPYCSPVLNLYRPTPSHTLSTIP
jgi:hypothetical protein